MYLLSGSSEIMQKSPRGGEGIFPHPMPLFSEIRSFCLTTRPPPIFHPMGEQAGGSDHPPTREIQEAVLGSEDIFPAHRT